MPLEPIRKLSFEAHTESRKEPTLAVSPGSATCQQIGKELNGKYNCKNHLEKDLPLTD